jgi:hypothetical protein
MRPFKRKSGSIRKCVQVTFDDLWDQYVSTVETPDQRVWSSIDEDTKEDATHYDETEGKRRSFHNAVLGLVESYLANPEDVEAAVKLAFEIAPKEQWSRGYVWEGLVHFGGADAALDQWGTISVAEETFKGPSARGLVTKTDDFR